MIDSKLKEILAAGAEADIALQKSGLTKEDLKPLADEGNLDAAIVLLIGESARKCEFWTEPFEDEDTHEVIQLNCFRRLDDFLFDFEPEERADLAAKVAAQAPSMDSARLRALRSVISGQISVVPYVEELAKRGDKDAIDTLERWEEERNYHPLEHPQDLADDFDPRDAVIKISGAAADLDRIESMIEDLVKVHGDPGNEAGLFLNLKYIFEALGFDWVDNTGNLMHITRSGESGLTMELECNYRVDEALVEAFQKVYPELTVEVADNK